MESKEEQFKAKTDLLEHQLSFFQKISDLPDDKRVEALKHEYESKLTKLQDKLEAQAKAQPEDAETLNAAIKELRSEEGRYFKIEKSKIWDMASKLVEFETFARLAQPFDFNIMKNFFRFSTQKMIFYRIKTNFLRWSADNQPNVASN